MATTFGQNQRGTNTHEPRFLKFINCHLVAADSAVNDRRSVQVLTHQEMDVQLNGRWVMTPVTGEPSNFFIFNAGTSQVLFAAGGKDCFGLGIPDLFFGVQLSLCLWRSKTAHWSGNSRWLLHHLE